MKFIDSSLRTLTILTVLATTHSVVQAQSFSSVSLQGATPGASGGVVGLATISTPEYMGSDERRQLAVPLVDYQWANGWFAGMSNGIGYNASSQPNMQYGARLTADFGREASRSKVLTHMGDINTAAELGVFFNYFPTNQIGLTSSLRRGAGVDKDGVLLDLGLGWSTQLAPQWRVGANLSATLANDSYMQSYFGVTAAQAGKTGYRVYSPKAGLLNTSVGLNLVYQTTHRVFVTMAVSSSALGNNAKDSPLTRANSSATAMVAVGYSF